MKDKLLSFLVLPSIMFALFLAFSPVGRVEAGDTCPHTGDGWVKIEPLSGVSFMYTAPEGKLVAESCYKVGSHDPVFQPYDPAQSSVTVTSTLLNPNGNAVQELSHASFRLVDAIHPFVRITYICELPTNGTVEGWGETGLAGDHLWRVRHEQGGPGTAFTLMKGGSIFAGITGYINTGQTLLYLTQEEFNGVSVKTTPLSNLYRGTASVSGAICTMEEKCSLDDSILADDPRCVPCEWDGTILADNESCKEQTNSCVETADGPIVWGPWTVDPNDPTQEYRGGQFTKYDVNDPTISCGTEAVDPERRNIPDDRDTEGVQDETGVVLAATGPADNILVYVVELLLVAMLVTYSVFFTKTYLKNSK